VTVVAIEHAPLKEDQIMNRTIELTAQRRDTRAAPEVVGQNTRSPNVKMLELLDHSSSAFADQTRGAVSVLTIKGPVDSDAVSEIGRRVSQALADDPRLVVDLLTVPAMNPQIPSELGAALRNASTATARLAIITADRRLHDALELSGIDGLELHHSITAALAVWKARPSPVRATRPDWRWPSRQL
jgi:anti-anti-sigma regulatory factor